MVVEGVERNDAVPVLPDGELEWFPRFLARDEADRLFPALRDDIDWQQHRLRVFGREVAAPRLSAWIGDPDAIYVYSGTRFVPAPWTPPLAALRDRLQCALAARFDSVLANLYRDGRDAMGWHADDEPELGPAPVIASLSLGAARTFRFRERATRKTVMSLELPHGSLLVMRGATQRVYQHALPRRLRVTRARINLTFRCVAPASRHAGDARMRAPLPSC